MEKQVNKKQCFGHMEVDQMIDRKTKRTSLYYWPPALHAVSLQFCSYQIN